MVHVQYYKQKSHCKRGLRESLCLREFPHLKRLYLESNLILVITIAPNHREFKHSRELQFDQKKTDYAELLKVTTDHVKGSSIAKASPQ